MCRGMSTRPAIVVEGLQKSFGTCLRPPQHSPLHVINTALNLTAGEKLAWQQLSLLGFGFHLLSAIRP